MGRAAHAEPGEALQQPLLFEHHTFNHALGLRAREVCAARVLLPDVLGVATAVPGRLPRGGVAAGARDKRGGSGASARVGVAKPGARVLPRPGALHHRLRGALDCLGCAALLISTVLPSTAFLSATALPVHYLIRDAGKQLTKRCCPEAHGSAEVRGQRALLEPPPGARVALHPS